MRCPTCDKKLRAFQAETMIGNPEFNEWCRNGYCSHECYERRDPSTDPVPIKPEGFPKPAISSESSPKTDWNKPEPISYSLATYSILAVPLYLGLSLLGRIFRVHQSPDVALLYFGILFAFLMLTGLAAGVVALISIRKHGASRLLWKSVIGILLIGGFSYLGISDILKSKAERGGGAAAEEAY